MLAGSLLKKLITLYLKVADYSYKGESLKVQQVW